MATEDTPGWERAWLDWARPIVRTSIDNPAHYARCRDLLGPAEYPHDERADPASDPSLRWPGYVGATWQPEHGILFVGSVHSDFTKDGGRKGDADRVQVVARLAEANRRWRDTIRTSAADAEYLRETRYAYTTLIPSWSRDSAFAMVRDHLDEPLEAIAWTNLAHCRARPQKTNEYKLQKECSGIAGAFPLGGLIAALRPAVVLACVAPLERSHRNRYQLRAPDGWTPELYAFSGRDGTRDGHLPAAWSGEVAAQIAAIRRGSAEL